MQTPSSHFDVLIAGGSYAGLALAVALSRQSAGDLRIAVASPDFPRLDDTSGVTDVRASALSRGSLNLLDALGLWQPLAPFAETVRSIALTDSALDDALRPPLMSYDTDGSGADGSSTPAMVIVENRRVGTLLHRAAREASGVTLLSGTTLTTFAAGTDDIVTTASNAAQFPARLLVAADGGRSRLREHAGIKSIGWPYHQSGIVVMVRPELPHQGRAFQHFLPAGPFALLPMTDNRYCVTWSENQAEASRILALPPPGFHAELERRCGPQLGHIEIISAPQSWPLRINVARAMVARRFALVGDAAHGVHPIAGQGLNLGFRDVAALTESIIDAAKLGLDIGQPTTLERYERWRRFDNLASAAAFDVLNRSFSAQSTLARSARGTALGLADGLPALKSWLVTEASGASGDVPALLRSHPAA